MLDSVLTISEFIDTDDEATDLKILDVDNLVVPDVPGPSDPFPKVKRVIWLDLIFGIKLVDEVITLGFRYENHNKTLPVPKDRDDVVNVLKASLNTAGRNREPSRPTTYSDETPLSINGDEECLMVILELPSNRNLRFNKEGTAISTSLGDKKKFVETGILDGANKLQRYGQVRAGANNLNCRTAYFIVDASETDELLRGDSDPSPTIPTKFNIHLDLGGRLGSGRPFNIPIIIDPDVRFPGGGGAP